ncbi:hypothetical protein C1645_836831 [Glomus cerebriforme]|uniref:Uncharacterized protein n=1 Tax=Glomus cerebriforme TaxID=658196 RepID=A0A397SFM0_9GLOM|nr:hypothetical protein C1645_836831 [Glomus cerebriforme]
MKEKRQITKFKQEKRFAICDDVFEQIKDFNIDDLTEEQKLLIDKLILNEELKYRYKEYCLCRECKKPKTSSKWCTACNAKHFQQNFKKWTSGNDDIDKFIQDTQLSATIWYKALEWIPYDRFYDIEYIKNILQKADDPDMEVALKSLVITDKNAAKETTIAGKESTEEMISIKN